MITCISSFNSYLVLGKYIIQRVATMMADIGTVYVCFAKFLFGKSANISVTFLNLAVFFFFEKG